MDKWWHRTEYLTIITTRSTDTERGTDEITRTLASLMNHSRFYSYSSQSNPCPILWIRGFSLKYPKFSSEEGRKMGEIRAPSLDGRRSNRRTSVLLSLICPSPPLTDALPPTLPHPSQLTTPLLERGKVVDGIRRDNEIPLLSPSFSIHF